MKRKDGTTPQSVEGGVCEVEQVNPATVAAARAALPPSGVLRRAADAFRVLANPNRLRVLRALEGRELCVCDLREVLGISMSGTSQVLRELRNLGAVDFRVDGKLAYYHLADSSWLELAETVLAKIPIPPHSSTTMEESHA